MITGLRYDAFHSIRKKFNDKDSLKNIDIIYAFLFSHIIVHGTYVLLSLKCKITAIWLVETACIFLIFLIATVQISMECETQES